MMTWSRPSRMTLGLSYQSGSRSTASACNSSRRSGSEPPRQACRLTDLLLTSAPTGITLRAGCRTPVVVRRRRLWVLCFHIQFCASTTGVDCKPQSTPVHFLKENDYVRGQKTLKVNIGGHLTHWWITQLLNMRRLRAPLRRMDRYTVAGQ